MDIFFNERTILNLMIVVIGLLFLILVSIQFTLNKILCEIKAIRVQKEKQINKNYKDE